MSHHSLESVTCCVKVGRNLRELTLNLKKSGKRFIYIISGKVVVKIQINYKVSVDVSIIMYYEILI